VVRADFFGVDFNINYLEIVPHFPHAGLDPRKYGNWIPAFAGMTV
jgi:hypothetical protein